MSRQPSLRRRLLLAGLSASLVAAVATTGIAVVAGAAGVSFEVEGEAIPMAGYAQMTLIGAVLGVDALVRDAGVVGVSAGAGPAHLFVLPPRVVVEVQAPAEPAGITPSSRRRSA